MRNVRVMMLAGLIVTILLSAGLVAYAQPFPPASDYISNPTEPPDPVSWRIAGSDRFGTAVGISRFFHEDQRGVQTVAIANGATMVDAMTAGASLNMTDLGFQKGPLLLVLRDQLPEETRVELERLAPCNVVFFGGEDAISEAVVAEVMEHADDEQDKC